MYWVASTLRQNWPRNERSLLNLGGINEHNTSSVHCSVMSESLQPYGLYPASLLCPWDFPGEYTGVGCHALLQRSFPTRSNLGLLHCTQILYRLSHQMINIKKIINTPTCLLFPCQSQMNCIQWWLWAPSLPASGDLLLKMGNAPKRLLKSREQTLTLATSFWLFLVWPLFFLLHFLTPIGQRNLPCPSCLPATVY